MKTRVTQTNQVQEARLFHMEASAARARGSPQQIRKRRHDGHEPIVDTRRMQISGYTHVVLYLRSTALAVIVLL